MFEKVCDIVVTWCQRDQLALLQLPNSPTYMYIWFENEAKLFVTVGKRLLLDTFHVCIFLHAKLVP